MHTANFWSSGARFALGSSGFGSESSKARGNERPVASTSRRPVRSALATAGTDAAVDASARMKRRRSGCGSSGALC